MHDFEEFIRLNTMLERPSLVPELSLHLASKLVPLWEATESELEKIGVSPPYWAFAWPGGQALARFVIDNPHMVAGRRVLDFAAGSGIGAIAAAYVGAIHVMACDIDPVAATAIGMNSTANGLNVSITTEDLTTQETRDWDVVLAGDVCYERAMAGQVWNWLQRLAGEGVLVLLGDPGRSYKPGNSLVEIARYNVPTSLELEDRTMRNTGVWKVVVSQ